MDHGDVAILTQRLPPFGQLGVEEHTHVHQSDQQQLCSVEMDKWHWKGIGFMLAHCNSSTVTEIINIQEYVNWAGEGEWE